MKSGQDKEGGCSDARSNSDTFHIAYLYGQTIRDGVQMFSYGVC